MDKIRYLLKFDRSMLLNSDTHKKFVSEHGLRFEVGQWHTKADKNNMWFRFRIGTCEGIWRYTKDSYDILEIHNKLRGNGHVNDVFEWFEMSCKRDKVSFRILEVLNEKFRKHLVEKRGFVVTEKFNVEKKYL